MLELVMIADATNFCGESANIWQFIGWILFVFKIAIPILLIVLGMIDLGKAVVGSKEDEIKKSTTSLVKRAVAGVIIFFIPTIISVIFGLVDNNENWLVCRSCVSNPGGNECSNAQDEVIDRQDRQ